MSGFDILFSLVINFDASNRVRMKHIAIISVIVNSVMYPKFITYSEEDIFWSHSVYFIGSSRYAVGWSIYTGLQRGTTLRFS